jgi:hypothetical protein
MASPDYNVTSSSFYTDLRHFLAHSGARYSADVVFDPSTANVVLSTRLSGFHVTLRNSNDQVSHSSQTSH